MKKLFFVTMFLLLILTQRNIDCFFPGPEEMGFGEDQNYEKNIDTKESPSQLLKVLKKAAPWLVFAIILSIAYGFNQQEEAERFCYDIGRILSNQCSYAIDFNSKYKCVYDLLISELKEQMTKCNRVRCMQWLERTELSIMSKETINEMKQCILDYIHHRYYKPNPNLY